MLQLLLLAEPNAVMGSWAHGCEWDGGAGGAEGAGGVGGGRVSSLEAILIPGTYSTDPGNIL